MAGLVMLTRISIKVMLAWSTCAQMGLMLLECGLGLYELALVHLLAHSLYKAHAFLAAGETVAQARQHALQPAVPQPGLGDLLWALLLAGLALALLQGAWTWLQPGPELPLVALAILAVGLAPWCLRRGQVLYGLAMFALLLGGLLLTACNKPETQPVSSWPHVAQGSYAAAISADARYAAVSSIQDGVALWDLQNNALLYQWRHQDSSDNLVFTLAISDDNSHVVTADHSTFALWRTADGHHHQTPKH